MARKFITVDYEAALDMTIAIRDEEDEAT